MDRITMMQSETTQIAKQINNSLKETQATADRCIEYLKQLANLLGIKIKIPTLTDQPSGSTTTNQKLEALETKIHQQMDQQIKNSKITNHKSGSTTTDFKSKSAQEIQEPTTDLSGDGDLSEDDGDQ